MNESPAHPSARGRHRPRPIDSTGARPAGRRAPVIVNWYWVRRAAMAPLYPSRQVWPS